MNSHNLPILYSFRRCPYAIRARLALAYVGIQCEVREVSLKEKPSEMLLLSPKGTVPVLVLSDGSVIDESLEIMQWALAQSDADLFASESADTLIKRNDSYFKYHLDRYKYPQRFVPQTNTDFHRQQAELFLAELEQHLTHQSNLCAEQVSIADSAIFPFVRQFAAVEPEHFASLAFPHLQVWLRRWLDSNLFGSVMRRHAQWHPGDTEQRLF